MKCDPPPIPRVVRGTFEWFVRSEVSGSILLLACTVVALILANSPLAGIGFTMSLFITGLAFPDQALVANAKVGILAASLLSGIIGSAILSQALPKKERTP
jgi:Na+/H+ antiporter NhaA